MIRFTEFVWFDGPCPFLACLEEHGHRHAVCPTCGAVRCGNAMCPTCAAVYDAGERV